MTISMWRKPQSNRARYFGVKFFRFGFVFVMLQVRFGIQRLRGLLRSFVPLLL